MSKEVEDIIFGGGVTPDIKVPEVDEGMPKEFDMFGGLDDADENVEESLQEEDVDVGEPTNSGKQKNTPTTEQLLLQQNQLLQQQLANMGNNGRISAEEQKALDTGKAILNLQTQNPMLYNKLNSFIASELSGESLKVQNNKLNELKQMLKGEKFKSVDVSPFEAMIDAVELSEVSTKKETQQLLQIINGLQRDIHGLKQDKENSVKQTVENKEKQAILALKKAELEFGKKILKDSEEAEDFVLLVSNGRDPRQAYLKVMGLKETDKLKKTTPKEVNLNPPKIESNQGVSKASKVLADKLFAKTKTSKEIFKSK